MDALKTQVMNDKLSLPTRVLLYYLDVDDWCDVSLADLAKLFGVSIDQVVGARKRLIAVGALERKDGFRTSEYRNVTVQCPSFRVPR